MVKVPTLSQKETQSEERNLEQTIDDYFFGMHQRDLTRLRRAFHPNARLFGHLNGELVEMALDDWLAKVQARPIPSENGEPFDMNILSVDITGKVAAVKVRDLYRGLRFTDYLQLVNDGNSWRIVSKIFQHD